MLEAPMLNLDAATILLQWATGGLAFLWVTSRRREVGIGYGWLLRGLYGLMALGAVIVGFRYHTVVVREIASIGVALACGVGLLVSWQRRTAGVARQREQAVVRSARIEQMTGIDRDEQR